MSVLSDVSIAQAVRQERMIEPFIDRLVDRDDNGNRIVSYGLSSFGYDIRLADEFRLFSKPNDGRVIDIKNFDDDRFSEYIQADSIIIPPGALVLGRSVEYLRIPNDITVQCLGKSTYARVGLFANLTPAEAGWEGHLVIEITNGTNLPAKVYAHEGIVQLQFFQGDRKASVTYGARSGKYQGQTGITVSKL